jgi:hypothetical protein
MIGTDTIITNTISKGAGENELYMTFTFEWDFPNIQGGSEASDKEEELTKEGALVVPSAIDQIRNMVREGIL